jgi:glycosyltransferase involved in cell wall biosynthesis
MATDPRFTVVMPAYNAAGTIESAVASALRQTIQELELIVVDDGSTDDTLARLERFSDDPRVRVVSQQNRGPGAARNTAIGLARGEIVSMLDSDDLWLPTYLSAMDAALRTEPAAGFAYTDAWLLGDEGKIARKTAMSNSRPPRHPPRDPQQMLLALLEGNFIYTSASVPRPVLEDVGGFDERFTYGEDYELWLRILESGRSAIRADGILAVHRTRDESLTADKRRFYQGIATVYSTVAREHELPSEARERARAKAAWWERQVLLVTEPTAVRRLTNVMRQLKRHLTRSRRWLPEPPAAVVETVRACETADGSLASPALARSGHVRQDRVQ